MQAASMLLTFFSFVTTFLASNEHSQKCWSFLDYSFFLTKSAVKCRSCKKSSLFAMFFRRTWKKSRREKERSLCNPCFTAQDIASHLSLWYLFSCNAEIKVQTFTAFYCMTGIRNILFAICRVHESPAQRTHATERTHFTRAFLVECKIVRATSAVKAKRSFEYWAHASVDTRHESWNQRFCVKENTPKASSF